jgi:hypothetical protein
MSAPVKPARKRAQAIAQGRGAGERLVLPLAFDTAANISARPLDEFRHDPTQLANGLLELHRAIGSDGICCALGGEHESAAGGPLDVAALCASGTRVAASLEACRRLRATLGDGAALLAGITGPATLATQFGTDFATAATAFTALVKCYCDAGCDLVVVFEDSTPQDAEAWSDALKTAGNIARFHRALALSWDGGGPLPQPVKLELHGASASAGVITTIRPVAADESIETLRAWVAGLRT